MFTALMRRRSRGADEVGTMAKRRGRSEEGRK